MSEGPRVLSYQDSNLDKQNQNLLCYHYTIRQSYSLRHIPAERPKAIAKLVTLSVTAKFFLIFRFSVSDL